MAPGGAERLQSHGIGLGAAEIAIGFDGNPIPRGLNPSIHLAGQERKHGARRVGNAT